MKRLCLNCGREMDDFELGCGPGSMGCWYCTKHCPNCHKVVFDQDIIYGDLRKYCRYCRVEVEEEERQILEDDLDDDEDDIEDEYEEDDSLFGKSQVLELSQEDIDDEYEEDDIISILKSIVKIAFYLALLVGILIAVIAIMMRRK